MRRGAEAAGSGRGHHLRRLTRALALAAAALFLALRAAAAQPYAEVSAGSLRVLHAPRHAALAREVLATARRPLVLPGLGAVSLPEWTTIVLAPSADAFRAATGGGAPEWAGGVAIPSRRAIVLPIYPSAAVREQDAAVTLRHEIAHLVLHHRLPEPIPRWFDEGYAEVASGGWDVESAWQLRVAFLLGRAPPLDSLALAWPADEGQARLAYLLSATAVQHLQRVGGEPGFAHLLQNWRSDGTLSEAIRTTYGMSLGRFEDDWRADVRNRYGWLFALASVSVLWGVVTVATLLAWYPRRRRNRKRLEAMRAEERMLPPPRPDWEEVDYPIAEPPPERE